jgi:hypothetical protein
VVGRWWHEGNGTRDQTLCPSLGLHCDRTLHLEKRKKIGQNLIVISKATLALTPQRLSLNFCRRL